MLRAGVLLVICSGTRQGTEAVPAVGGVRGSGACPAEDPHPRARHPGCIPGESEGIEQENWDVLTGRGQEWRPRWRRAMLGAQGKQNQIQTQTRPHTEGKRGRNNPFWRVSPACPQPIPADLEQDRVRVRVRVRAHSPLPDSERNRQLSGHRAPDNGGVKVHPSGDWLPVCPSHLHVKVSPAAPNPPRSHGRFGRRTGSTWVAG